MPGSPADRTLAPGRVVEANGRCNSKPMRCDIKRQPDDSTAWPNGCPGRLGAVGELSRPGRPIGQIVKLLGILVKREIRFIVAKEDIRIDGRQDIRLKVMTTFNALFAKVERDLVSERTREGPAKAGASGKRLERPRGFPGKSGPDGLEAEIRGCLDSGVSKASIAPSAGAPRTFRPASSGHGRQGRVMVGAVARKVPVLVPRILPADSVSGPQDVGLLVFLERIPAWPDPP